MPPWLSRAPRPGLRSAGTARLASRSRPPAHGGGSGRSYHPAPRGAAPPAVEPGFRRRLPGPSGAVPRPTPGGGERVPRSGLPPAPARLAGRTLAPSRPVRRLCAASLDKTSTTARPSKGRTVGSRCHPHWRRRGPAPARQGTEGDAFDTPSRVPAGVPARPTGGRRRVRLAPPGPIPRDRPGRAFHRAPGSSPSALPARSTGLVTVLRPVIGWHCGVGRMLARAPAGVKRRPPPDRPSRRPVQSSSVSRRASPGPGPGG